MVLFAPCLGGSTRLGSMCRLVLLIATALIGQATRLSAQETQADPNLPLVVINVASVERLLNQALVTFEAAGRPELTETLGGVLERVNDLKGFDRTASVGVMVYLNGLMPEMVGYAPVQNLDEVLKTLEIGPITTKKTGDDRFEIVGRRQTFYGKVLADYAFIANSATALDREFRDPAGLTARLSRAYDLAVSLNLKSIAPQTRELFIGMVRAKSESDLQRRDNEPVSAHRLRKAAGQRNIDLIEELLMQGEELTVGWAVSAADRTASLEVVVGASPMSELATYFNELKGARSRFAGLLSAKTPLTAALSWKLDRSAKKMLQEMIGGIEVELNKKLGTTVAEPDSTANESPFNPVQQLIHVLRATTEAGHIDMVLQFFSQPSGSFVLVGGLKVAEPAALSNAVGDIFTRLKENKAVADIRLNVLEYNGVSLHRLEFNGIRPQDQKIYGGKPDLYAGVGDDVLWLAVGGDDAPAELKRVIEKGAEPVPEDVPYVPLQFVMNFANWMDVFDPEKKPDGIAELARKSFAKGGDSLRIEARPIDNGIRLRITMDEAFLRLYGQAIAKQIDAGQQ